MADYGIGFLGIYIAASELQNKPPVTMTIKDVKLEKVESMKKTGDDEDSGKVRDRWIVYFAESKSGRGWLLNRTNCESIKELWGRETNDWIGHKITLHTVPVRVGPKMDIGIRIKGSPELTESRTFQLRLPRKKPIPMTLVPTGKAKPESKPEPKEDVQFASLADALALWEGGDQEAALDLRAGLSEDDQARFDIETNYAKDMAA